MFSINVHLWKMENKALYWSKRMLATTKTSEALWSVYMVGFQQAITISRNFISRRLWLILTVTVYVCNKLGLLFDLVGEGGGMYVLVKCRALWESRAWSVSVKMVGAQWRSMSVHDVEWQWFCPFRCLIQAGWLKQAKTVTWALGANLLGMLTLMGVFWGEEGTSWVTLWEEKEEEGNSWEKRGVTAQKVLAYSWCQFYLACCVQAGLLLTFQGVKEIKTQWMALHNEYITVEGQCLLCTFVRLMWCFLQGTIYFCLWL